MHRDDAIDELIRLRNRHVAKVLLFLGDGLPPYIEAAIKRSYSMFAEDVDVNIIQRYAKENAAPVNAGSPERLVTQQSESGDADE